MSNAWMVATGLERMRKAQLLAIAEDVPPEFGLLGEKASNKNIVRFIMKARSKQWDREQVFRPKTARASNTALVGKRLKATVMDTHGSNNSIFATMPHPEPAVEGWGHV